VAARWVNGPKAIVSGYSDCYAVECDLRDQESIKRAVEKATDKLGCLEVVVNGTGILTRGPPHEASESDLNLVVNVNLLILLAEYFLG
jgi:NAD(P)-dependent dehydrogenase (short-subunit alcohol dehydrogenase family)